MRLGEVKFLEIIYALELEGDIFVSAKITVLRVCGFCAFLLIFYFGNGEKRFFCFCDSINYTSRV